MTMQRWFAALALLLGSSAVPAGGVSPGIEARLAKLFPGEKISSVSASPLPGVYEVVLGASLLYLSEDGRYVFHGDLIDLDRRVNLSDVRRESARKGVFAGIDAGDLVTFEPAAGKLRKALYVYTDIDCAYCRKMHTEVPRLNAAGIAVRYLAFPRSGPDGDSGHKAAAVWCAADRQAAMTAAKAGKNVSYRQCDNPVAEQFELGRAMGVSGTPAVYTDEGRQLGGYVPAAELIKMLDDGKI